MFSATQMRLSGSASGFSSRSLIMSCALMPQSQVPECSLRHMATKPMLICWIVALLRLLLRAPTRSKKASAALGLSWSGSDGDGDAVSVW